MWNTWRMLTLALVWAGTALLAPLRAEAPSSSGLAQEAKLALDAHYGDPKQIALAAGLLTKALELNRKDPSVYVQAARLAVKGGHLAPLRFRPGTLEAYGDLLDRALELDPNNAKARILKAEYFHFIGDHRSERAELDKAKATGTKDSWLQVGYGRFFRETNDVREAAAQYTQARQRGPGSTLEQRNAYVSALNGLALLAAEGSDRKALVELSEAIRSGRDPRDAWALGSLAESLVVAGMFDSAIAAAREALSTMEHGAARLTLTAALYGKAAELELAYDRAAADKLVDEARSHGYDPRAVLGRFDFATPEVAPLQPTIEALLALPRR